MGKQIPESFKIDPEQSYRINGMTKEGLWEISEAESQFKKRKQPRYWVSIGMLVSLLQRADKSVVKEETFTQNIAAGGASVACTLSANVGDKVKVAVKELDFYAIAVVRNRKASKDETPTLHLEFIDAEFPVEKIIAARTLLPCLPGVRMLVNTFEREKPVNELNARVRCRLLQRVPRTTLSIVTFDRSLVTLKNVPISDLERFMMQLR